MWTDLPRPIVVAHRGANTEAPENTLAAFALASKKGAIAIEFDVKLTSDGQVIVLHDRTVNRTTNGTGNISRISLAELRNLDAGAWFSEQFRGEKIPTLDEVFDSLGNRLYMNVELTNYATPNDDLVLKVVETVRRHNLHEYILFSSFNPQNLKKAQILLPEVPRGLLTSPGIMGFWGRTFTWRGDYFALHPYLAEVNEGLISRVHAKGKRIHVYTVNVEEDIIKMVSLGVDAIITDDPTLALRLLGER